MRESGSYHAEKCDKCGDPLRECTYAKQGPGKNETWCMKCGGKGKDLLAANLKQEASMAKVAKAKKEEKKGAKLFGKFSPGTAIYDLVTLLLDEKKHTLAEAKKICAKYDVDAMGRVQQLKRYGIKLKTFNLEIEEDYIKLVVGKGVDPGKPLKKGEEEAMAAPTKKKGKEEKLPKKKKSESEEEEDSKPAKTKKKKKEPEPEPEETPEEESEESEEETTDEPEEETTDEPSDEPEEEEEVEASETKALKSTILLVRRTLTGSKKDDWTKNTLTDHIVKKNKGVDSKRVLAAINAEIKNGGLEVNDGQLQLAEG
jgi:hypothetical protein